MYVNAGIHARRPFIKYTATFHSRATHYKQTATLPIQNKEEIPQDSITFHCKPKHFRRSPQHTTTLTMICKPTDSTNFSLHSTAYRHISIPYYSMCCSIYFTSHLSYLRSIFLRMVEDPPFSWCIVSFFIDCYCPPSRSSLYDGPPFFSKTKKGETSYKKVREGGRLSHRWRKTLCIKRDGHLQPYGDRWNKQNTDEKKRGTEQHIV